MLAAFGDNLFNPLSFILCIAGVVFLHLSSNLFNDYFDVKHGTDGINYEYFNADLNSTMLEGAQLSGGSRAIELGLITLNGTKRLTNIMLLLTVFCTLMLLINSYIAAQSFNNLIMALLIGFIGWFLGYFYTAKPIRLSARGLGELAIFLTFGPLLTLGAYYTISSSTIELFSQGFYNAIYIGIPFGFLTTNIYLLINLKF